MATAAADLSEEAVASDNFAVAKQLNELALDEAKKSGDKLLSKRLSEQADQANQLAETHEAVQTAAATLEKTPLDPQANLVVGRYLCLIKADWKMGRSMLALGSDAALKALALQEMEGPAAADQVKLADGWWAAAEKEEGAAKKSLQNRAGHWYKKALPGLSGLVRGKAEKRLAELDKDDAAAPTDSGSPRQQPCPAILLDLQNKTIVVDDAQAFNEKMASLFPSSQNKAKDGVLTISSWESSSWAPHRVFSGYRTGKGCRLADPKGAFVATWKTPPRGRYILLFARTESEDAKGADPWGAATVSVDGSQAVPLHFMTSQKVAVLDLGRTWRIQKIRILVRGDGHPGLAGIEIHESPPGMKPVRSGFKPAPISGHSFPGGRARSSGI